ncbi:hypothetical protein KP79_PYT22707 [Mizuhopecten yessoensis]|uniref:Uncharacterized protein n=1 Tax=Mizuhopecten yessoensis TaxID=6573 RepID=A0A210PS07_MIZYE|nr:hypothetical protein KP79_PYT22707 [Mizuhopecten yessoensis]
MGNIEDTDDYIPDIEEEQEDEDSDELNEVYAKRKRPQPCQRQKWLAEEEEELKDLFQRDCAINKLPGQKRIEEMMKKSLENKGSIHQRKRDTIKKKLSNMMIKRGKSQN